MSSHDNSIKSTFHPMLESFIIIFLCFENATVQVSFIIVLANLGRCAMGYWMPK
jgi:hypothetical protein